MRTIWIVLFCISAVLINPVAVAAECTVIVGEYEVNVGDMVQVPIRVEDGIDLGSLDLNLTFNPSLLSAESAESALKGDFDNTVVNLEDADRGRIKVIGYQSTNHGLDNCTVIKITFRALKAGKSSINLEVVTLTDATPACNNLIHTVRNGTVTISEDVGGAGYDHTSNSNTGGSRSGSRDVWWFATTPPGYSDENVGGESFKEAAAPTPKLATITQSATQDTIRPDSMPGSGPETIPFFSILIVIIASIGITGVIVVLLRRKKRCGSSTRGG